MECEQKIYYLWIMSAVLVFGSVAVDAVEIRPGVGVAIEHTNNVELSAKDKASDNIAVAYVGANITEDEGPLNYDAVLGFNRYNYLQGSFDDSRYFNLAANADWEMIKDRFNWFMSDIFTQQTIDSFDVNTPDNLQDSNVFTFGANIIFPFSARNSFTLTPLYNQYYYELQTTNNKQYSLEGNWNYKMTRRTNIGLSLSTRNIDYTQTGVLGGTVEDTRFTNLSFIFSGRKPRSSYAISLGSTSVKRDGGEETSGFSGNIDWTTDLTSRSSFNINASTELTDSSTVSLGDNAGLPNSNVPVTTDVIRNSIFYIVYQREDASLRTSVRAEYNEVDYSESPLDQEGKILVATLDYPLTRRLTSGSYINYNNTKRVSTARVDKGYIWGGNLRYNFSRKLLGRFDLTYRENDSTIDSEKYDEFTAYVSLVYGFGEVYRPSRVATGF